MTIRDNAESYMNLCDIALGAVWPIYISHGFWIKVTGVQRAKNGILNCEYEYTRFRTVLRKGIIGLLLHI